MDCLPVEILQKNILNILDIRDQRMFIRTSAWIYTSIAIEILATNKLSSDTVRGLSQKVMKRSYKHLRVYKNHFSVRNISLNYLKDTLIDLDISHSHIGQQDISELRLKRLNISGNVNITRLNCFKDSLTSLTVNYKSSLHNEDIMCLSKLKKLDMTYNENITNINFFCDTLEWVSIIGSKMTNDGICECRNLKIIHESASYDAVNLLTKVTNINFASDNLEQLYTKRCCNITQQGFSKCVHIQKLCMPFNQKISNLDHIKDTLTSLNISSCFIGQEAINKCIHLITLNLENNEYVNNVNHLSETLKELNVSGIVCAMSQKGINNCKKIEILSANHNESITDVNFLSETLHSLEIDGCSGVGQAGFDKCLNIYKLHIQDNKKVMNIDHLKDKLIHSRIKGSNIVCTTMNEWYFPMYNRPHNR